MWSRIIEGVFIWVCAAEKGVQQVGQEKKNGAILSEKAGRKRQ